ncbi:MAG: septum formation family protein, partial [Marmoricola sp.]
MLGRAHLVLALACLALVACSNPLQSENDSDRKATPKIGACRNLTASELSTQTNASTVVKCSQPHTAVTFASGTLPFGTGRAYADARHNQFVFTTCQKAFAEFIGADESHSLRVRLSWAWFRPSERGWASGARWYRCDLVGG